MSAEKEFSKIVEYLASIHNGVAGQMFGKKCIKINSFTINNKSDIITLWLNQKRKIILK